MNDSGSGAENIQDETRAPCSTRKLERKVGKEQQSPGNIKGMQEPIESILSGQRWNNFSRKRKYRIITQSLK